MKNLNVLFYLKSRKNSKGEQQIYLRLTVDGKRKETSLNRSISSSRWDKHKQCGKGRSEEILSLNKYLNSVKESLYKYQNEMIYNDDDITTETLINKYLDINENSKNLVEIIEVETKRIKTTVSTGTYKKYQAFERHMKAFIKHQFNVSDVSLKKVDYKFIIDFEFYLRTQKNIGKTTSTRYVKTLMMFFNTAKNNGWIHSNPFANYKGSNDTSERTKLTEVELQSIMKKDFKIERLNKIRDIFIFACYTGLSFGDLEKLSNHDINIGMNGKKWIKIKRAKTGNLSSIPLLPQASSILKKYENDPVCINRGILLPVISNERYNAYLKEIASICDINKNLTTHVARHTFATTVTAEKGVSLEVISRMLGHTQIKTTQIYSKITDIRISKDMKILLDEKSEDNDSKEAI